MFDESYEGFFLVGTWEGKKRKKKKERKKRKKKKEKNKKEKKSEKKKNPFLKEFSPFPLFSSSLFDFIDGKREL